MQRRSILFGMLVAAFAVSGVDAQTRGMGMGQGMHGGPMNMMPRLQAYAPEAVLERTDELRLTDNQTDELEAIAKNLDDTVKESQSLHDEHQHQLHTAVQASLLDPEVIGQHFWAAHGAMGRMHWAQVEASLKTFEVLTDRQRQMIEGS